MDQVDVVLVIRVALDVVLMAQDVLLAVLLALLRACLDVVHVLQIAPLMDLVLLVAPADQMLVPL